MWNFSWLALIGAALTGFLIGGLWYGPLFLKVWQREAGVTDAQMKERHPAWVFGGAFVLNLIASALLGHLFAATHNPPMHVKMMISTGIGVGFVATSIGVNYLFASKSLKLFLIDAGYFVVAYAAMGLVYALVG